MSQFQTTFGTFCPLSNTPLSHTSKRFIASKSALDPGTTETINLITNNFPQYVSSDYNEKHTEEPLNTRFIRLQIHKASYVGSMFQTSNSDTHKTIQFVYFLSTIKYGIFSGGNSSTMFLLHM